MGIAARRHAACCSHTILPPLRPHIEGPLQPKRPQFFPALRAGKPTTRFPQTYQICVYSPVLQPGYNVVAPLWAPTCEMSKCAAFAPFVDSPEQDNLSACRSATASSREMSVNASPRPSGGRRPSMDGGRRLSTDLTTSDEMIKPAWAAFLDAGEVRTPSRSHTRRHP